MAKSNSIEMTSGPLWGKILKFSATYMLTAVLQQLYSAADIMVVGRYAGQAALAGVGTSSVLVNLFLNFIMGFAAGATVVLGQAFGAKDNDKIEKATHTTMALAIWCGAAITVVCVLFTRQLMNLVDVPQNVCGEASVYIRIMALGYIPSLIYNFGSAILRAKGDNKRALYIVTISGIINVLLNLLFVCAFKMGASGVAAATVISQVFNAAVILYILTTESDETKLCLSKLKIYKEPLLKIIKLGLPSGIQSSVYSASNIIVQSSVNSFGSAAIAGGSASSSITDFYNVMFTSIYQGSIVFVSQNFGAKKFNRIKKSIFICMVYTGVIWVLQGAATMLFGKQLLSLYAPDNAEVIKMGMVKFKTLGLTYGILGFVNVLSGALRGMGASIGNLISSVAGVCGIRIIWIFTVFKMVGTFESLFLCYPASWLATLIFHSIMFLFVFKKSKKRVLSE